MHHTSSLINLPKLLSALWSSPRSPARLFSELGKVKGTVRATVGAVEMDPEPPLG